MSEEKFFERLRTDARPLRYEADDVAVTRLAARIRARIAERPTPSQLLARWFRPIAASMSALALVATIGIFVIERSDSTAVESIAANTTTMEIDVGGETYSVGD